MNFYRHTPTATSSRLSRGLSLILLTALISEANARMVTPTRSQPYLRVCLPPPLRYSAPVIPTEEPMLSIVVGPANPGGPLEAVAAENKASAKSVENQALPPVAPPLPPASPVPVADPVPAELAPVARQSSQPLSILPDDTPQNVHSEDLLPYFRLPTANAAPSSIPPSSATYHEQ